MNTAMYTNPVVQRNLEQLRRDGWTVIDPDSGVLACKDVGAGKLPQPENPAGFHLSPYRLPPGPGRQKNPDHRGANL